MLYLEMPILVRTGLLSLQRIGNFLIRQYAFAHFQEELRDKHIINQHYKTRVCTNFKKYGFCKYGERCQFLHLHEAPTVYSRPYEPLPSPPTSYSEKHSDSSDDFSEEKHQKNLDILANFGLEMLSM